jgi:peptide subunit release factor RF-3
MTIKDRQGRDVLLFESAWELRFVTEANPGIRLLDTM